MEADLARYYQTDLRDRWRQGPDGRALLTLRQLAVRVRHLPLDSATAVALNDGEPSWGLEHVLLADLWSSWTGKEHPRLAQAQRRQRRGRRLFSAERLRRLSDARSRARDRRRRIDAGELT